MRRIASRILLSSVNDSDVETRGKINDRQFIRYQQPTTGE